jgi:RimJ/RimL family protein N-acetyltransferase
MFTLKSRLETQNFTLIQTEPTHFDDLYQVAGDPLVWQQHPEQDRWKREKFTVFFNAGMNNDLGCFSIKDKHLSVFIGSTRFYSYRTADNSVRLGFTFLRPDYWGTSANAEIKKGLLDFAFEQVDTVYFDIGKMNIRSRKATEKLGAYMFETSDGDKVVYALNKGNYRL